MHCINLGHTTSTSQSSYTDSAFAHTCTECVYKFDNSLLCFASHIFWFCLHIFFMFSYVLPRFHSFIDSVFTNELIRTFRINNFFRLMLSTEDVTDLNANSFNIRLVVYYRRISFAKLHMDIWVQVDTKTNMSASLLWQYITNITQMFSE